MALKEWVRLPTDWINEGGLRGFRWTAATGANHTAALMLLAVLAHHADPETGVVKVTYDALTAYSTLSRAKISGGLKVLEERKVIERTGAQKNVIQLSHYKLAGGWGKLPAKGLYSHNRVHMFEELHLRKPVELHALKLYYLFVARRDESTNLAHISYDKIEEYTRIDRSMIKSAISLLATHSMIHVEQLPSVDYGISHAYRLVQLSPRMHMGTTGRRLMQTDGSNVALIPGREA